MDGTGARPVESAWIGRRGSYRSLEWFEFSFDSSLGNTLDPGDGKTRLQEGDVFGASHWQWRIRHDHSSKRHGCHHREYCRDFYRTTPHRRHHSWPGFGPFLCLLHHHPVLASTLSCSSLCLNT